MDLVDLNKNFTFSTNNITVEILMDLVDLNLTIKETMPAPHSRDPYGSRGSKSRISVKT